MAKRWTDPAAARQVADILTDLWMAAPTNAHSRAKKALAHLTAEADDCPECEVCCAIGLCCPLGSEAQRNGLAQLLVKG